MRRLSRVEMVIEGVLRFRDPPLLQAVYFIAIDATTGTA
jgi:hypothetical protein